MQRNELSFCIYSADGEGIKPEDLENQQLKRTATIGDCIDALGSSAFSFDDQLNLPIQEEEEDLLSHFSSGCGTTPPRSSVETSSRPPSPPLYLAAGLGINDGDFIDVDFNLQNLDEEGDIEEYYRNILYQYPFHPLLLKNYAQLLQSKGDLHGAVEYYYRATLADPNDAEILSQYAKLIWELERDQEITQSYFDQAIQVSPQDANVLGAYASFLWECDDDDEDEKPNTTSQIERVSG
ncbi:hypothetical protein ACFE04_012354 [Oxalis oulophora]